MPDKVMPGPVQDTACIREAVCIHTKKIYDSCKDKDIASQRYSTLCFFTIELKIPPSCAILVFVCTMQNDWKIVRWKADISTNMPTKSIRTLECGFDGIGYICKQSNGG